MLPLLTRDETCALAKLAQAGDIAARNELIMGYRGLVPPIAQNFLDRGLAMEDLVGEGNLGLFPAIARFDPANGAAFSTYATCWIKEAIRRALVTTVPMIRLPTHTVSLMTRWWRTRNALTKLTGHVPEFDAVATRLGLSDVHRDMVRKALRVAPARRRREGARLGIAAFFHLADQPDLVGPAESTLDTAEERHSLWHRLDTLSSRERAAIVWRFGLEGEEPLLQREIGARLGVSKEAVRKIVIRALRKMQRPPPIPSLARRPA